MNYEKSRAKSFIGGTVIGLLLGALVGGFTVACIMGTAFINWNIKNEKSNQVGQTTITTQRTSK